MMHQVWSVLRRSKKMAGALGAVLAGLSFSAFSAQGEAGLSIVQIRGKELALYANSTDGEAARRVAVESLALPLPVQGCTADFCSVNVQGQTFWIDQMQVKLNRASKAGCTVVQAPTVAVGAHAGAGENTCAKK